MEYLFLAFSLVIIFLLIVSRSVFYANYDKINFNVKKRLDMLLKLIYVAPIIVLFIIFILTVTYFRTKGYIRLSHAWFVVNFWICGTIFYYITIQIAKMRKLIMILPIIGLVISVCTGIFLTTLPHYERVFNNINLIIPNFLGLIMLLVSFYINYTLLTKETNHQKSGK
jgi:lysylphosphatidylglycerol synthetase-like protein (DUF2156 family)